MTRTYCTYFDSNYLVKGLALIESLNRWESSPFRLFVVCLDELAQSMLEKLRCPNVILVPLSELEAGDAALAEARGNRSRVEYYWTLTPTVVLRFLAEVAPGDSVTYLDADLFFYSAPEPIFSEFAGHSVLIHGHRFSDSQKHLEVYGKYNVGLLCFRRDDQGLKVVKWWQERCNEWCYDRAEDGKYGDQLYLNDWPERFPGVRVLEHVGAGVAPWNNDQYCYSVDDGGRAQVDGDALIFYHFHALAFITDGLIVPAKHTSYPLPEAVIRLCVTPYIDSLLRAVAAVRSITPDFSSGLTNRETWGLGHTFVAGKELAHSLKSNGIDHPTFDLGNGWDCYVTDQLSRVPVRTSLPAGKGNTRDKSQGVQGQAVQSLAGQGQAGQGNKGSVPQIVVATSIAPKDLPKQQAAVATWLQLGLRVLSLNNPDEIVILEAQFPGVEFVPAARNAKEMTGIPLVHFDDMLETLRSTGFRICGIINSDIHLRADRDFLEFIAREAQDSFIYGSRENILSTDHYVGTTYDSGFDFFFFDRSATALYAPTPFAIGATWWDYWAVVVPLLKNYPVKKLVSPVAFHVLHTQAWSHEQWHHLGGLFSSFLKELNYDFSTVDLNISVYHLLTHLNSISPRISYLPSRTERPAPQYRYLVSALVSTCNAGKFFQGCLENLLNQTLYQKGLLEIIIIDSGSEQDEEQIAKPYLESHDHIVYQRTERETLYAAWNRGVKLAQGKYLTHANTDDRHRSDAFELMARALDEDEGGLVYVDALITGAENESFEANSARENWLLPDFTLRQALVDSPFGCQVMWRAVGHAEVGMFDASYRRAGHYEFFLRLALQKGALHLRESLVLYHDSPNNLCSDAEEVFREVQRFIGVYRENIPLTALYPYLRQDDSAAAHATALVDFANHLMGVSASPYSDIPLAAKLYSRALELAPGDPEIIGNLAVAKLLQGKREDAIAVIRSVSAESPRLQHYLSLLRQGRIPQLTLTQIGHPALKAMPPVKSPQEIRIPRPAATQSSRIAPVTAPAQPGLPRQERLTRQNLPSHAFPKISLITPSYNYGRYLEACIDSILSQNYPNLEFIIMDGGSTDNSVEIIKKYQKHLAYWQSCPDAGQYSAIEEGFRRSTGEIMGWLNADDMFHPGAFDTVSSIFREDPATEWLMGRPNSFDEQGNQKHVLTFLPMNSRAKYLADEELIQQEGVFWRRGLWERSGAYIEKELLLAADLELWARFFRSATLLSVDTLIAGFRDHPLQKSKDKAAYTAEANRVLARERQIFAAEKKRFSPPAPLPFLLRANGAAL